MPERNLRTIHPIVVEIFQSETRWWTDPVLSSTEPCNMTKNCHYFSLCRVDLQEAVRERITWALMHPSAGAQQPHRPPPLPPQCPEPDHPAVDGRGRRGQGQPGTQGPSAALWRTGLPADKCDHVTFKAQWHRTLRVGAELQREQLWADHPHQRSKGVLVGWRDRYVVHPSQCSTCTLSGVKPTRTNIGSVRSYKPRMRSLQVQSWVCAVLVDLMGLSTKPLSVRCKKRPHLGLPG